MKAPQTKLRIVVASYMVRFPLGGMLSWTLQWLAGLSRLGHDVYFAEIANYTNACFDPRKVIDTDDPATGIALVAPLLERFGFKDRWTYVTPTGEFLGMTRQKVREVFRSADLFIDLGTHGAWFDAGFSARRNVMVDGEPGRSQIKLEILRRSGKPLPSYDGWFSSGALVGRPESSAPTAGLTWGHVFNPVVPELFSVHPPPPEAPFRTVMNWQSHAPLEFDGQTYRQKGVEFVRFIDLPSRTPARLEVAVGGKGVPYDRLRKAGWRTVDAIAEMSSFDRYQSYIAGARGEWSICKNVFVALRTGWFSERSAAFLASGRPVVLQDTGFSSSLPCGDGLFAFETLAQAAEAIETIDSDWPRYSRNAVALAREHLAADKVLSRFLDDAFNGHKIQGQHASPSPHVGGYRRVAD